MNSRRGYTLIELAVCMTAGVTLLVMCVGLLHQSMQLAKTEKGRAEQQRRADRLASEFRRDVHHATDVDVVSAQEVKLQSESQTTTYQATGNIVRKRQTRNGRLAQQDTFELGPDSSIKFDTQQSPARVQMTVVTGNPINSTQRIDRHVRAVIGRFPAELAVETSE